MTFAAIEPTSAPAGVHSAATFEDFFRANFPRVYGLLYRVTGNAHDAEDVSQELFLDLSRREPPIWQSPTASAWLWKAATHEALNALRGERRRRKREERASFQAEPVRLLSERDADPAGSAERHEQQAEVRRVLRQLKEREALLLLARHSGLSYAEIAAAVEVNVTSVGTLLARAEQHFKDLYLAQEEHHESV
ncbi:MAG: sigma-70 family RNA polymerase sigma factor [Chloroflexi bacterium]|nr:sigma-70 family RNA polymerase sigma factor [Chloroflexota bacterium]